MFRQKTCFESSTCLTGSHAAAQPPLNGNKFLCQAVTQAAIGAQVTLSYASRMVRRKNAAASLSLISRWKRCLRLGMGRPRPKQGSPLSCIRDTEATMPSATPRACRQQVELVWSTVAACICSSGDWPRQSACDVQAKCLEQAALH